MLVWLAGAPCFAEPAYSGVCPNGAPARKESYCSFIVHFRTGPGTLDRRIAENVGANNADQTRSIALIIAIEKYPVMKDDLTAAKVDGDKLVTFFIRQKFDEIIVLRDGDATTDNINYFLKDYLLNRPADFHNKSRLAVAYSGHGRPIDGAEQAAFLLSNVDDLHASSSIYGMDEFSNNLKRLAPLYFQVLTLINACYGGNVFVSVGTAGAGDPDTPYLPGSWAITAGDEQKQVPALIPGRGSVFFDLLIDGVDRGVADPLWWAINGPFDGAGNPLFQEGLTRMGALRTYLASAYGRIDQLRQHLNPPPGEILRTLWSGPIQSNAARGGFFFLSDRVAGTPHDLIDAYGTTDPAVWSRLGQIQVTAAETFSLPPGPISSLPNRPDIKVFKQPNVYPIHGYDFSSVDGTIDWPKFVSATSPRFAYVRASGWRGPDGTFEERWAALGRFGIDRGAYLKYNFCKNTGEQVSDVKVALASALEAALPVAVELVMPDEDQDKSQGVHQLPCYRQQGPSRTRDNIFTFLRDLQEVTGKVPVIYGNRSNLALLTDDRFDRFMLWLAAFGQTGNQLRGSNPWTLWQYSGTEVVPGVGDRTTTEVFFGTEDQYQLFRSGKTNAALAASLSK
jgi:lysozyme